MFNTWALRYFASRYLLRGVWWEQTTAICEPSQSSWFLLRRQCWKGTRRQRELGHICGIWKKCPGFWQSNVAYANWRVLCVDFQTCLLGCHNQLALPGATWPASSGAAGAGTMMVVVTTWLWNDQYDWSVAHTWGKDFQTWGGCGYQSVSMLEWWCFMI